MELKTEEKKKKKRKRVELDDPLDHMTMQKDIRSSRQGRSPASYWAKNPQPNYSNFGTPDFVDRLGREYRLPKKSNKMRKELEESGQIRKRPDSEDQQLGTGEDLGKQLLWIKIPIWLRNSVGFPSTDGKKLRILDTKSYTEMSMRVDSCFYGSNRKTGYLQVDKLKSMGSADPKEWQDIIRRSKREKKVKTPFGQLK